MPKGIIIFGLNGSGKSTLGRALAKELNYKFMDIEDYFFMESGIPYSKPRSKDECVSLMLIDISKHENFILSSVKGDYGPEISSLYKLGILLDAPYDVRINRVEQRMIDKFGDRVKAGGDMYESEMGFLEFVRNRRIDSVEKWSETLNCPVIRIDGTREISANVELIKTTYFKMQDR